MSESVKFPAILVKMSLFVNQKMILLDCYRVTCESVSMNLNCKQVADSKKQSAESCNWLARFMVKPLLSDACDGDGSFSRS